MGSKRNNRKPDPAPGETEYRFCKAYRRFAKLALECTDLEGELEAQPEREALLCDLWAWAADLWPWGQAEILNSVIRAVYEGEDNYAAQMLSELAEDELKAMKTEGAPGKPSEKEEE